MPRDRSRERSRERDRHRSRSREADRHRSSGRDKDKERDRDIDRDRRRRRDDDDRHSRRNRDSDRHRERDHERDRHRDRASSKGRTSDRDRDDRNTSGRDLEVDKKEMKEEENADGQQPANFELDAALTPEEMQMMQAMGIPFGFETTQGKHVEDDGANLGAVKLKQTRQARQYMNRRGGFNRPLPAERTGEKKGLSQVLRD